MAWNISWSDGDVLFHSKDWIVNNWLQEDLGGELFSLGELFPSTDCADKFLNYLPLTISGEEDFVANNFGTVQSTLGQLLSTSTEKFWVNAQKVPQGSPSLYKYEGESPHTYHFPPGTENRLGDCLTFSSDVDAGELITMVSRAKALICFVVALFCSSALTLSS